MTPISASSWLGLAGDWHGNLTHALTAIRAFHQRGIEHVLQLGDFGFIWSTERLNSGDLQLDEMNALLDSLGMTLWIIDGNHENHARIRELAADDSGIRFARSRVRILPRGWRATFPTGRVIAALGGANSIDRYARKPGIGWWSDEQIKEDDLAALGTDPVDVLLSHDAPNDIPYLRLILRGNEKRWDPRGLAYANAGQAQFQRGFLQVKPNLTVGGHYHLFVNQTIERDGFTSRHVILDLDDSTAVSQAVLDTDTLELLFFRLDGAPVRHTQLR
ncbi:metallophosphoesterase family protein [Rathayibacter iranicus]|uniref:Calcineurin-like phosphoesterase domain-containing protein n=2 Tax=Rathayibacter iranicus TaxID=59737 RepID=A0AAD2PTV7_9MICO|nr:metallophosphoesterase [Rathayibacter iranicus]AZZ54933.1 hypothetical protein C7V51_02815 [Rathayibacter iranicus]MWV32467.1 hypothetical protein [Rathayibacter iranicus NCPPB 2253 = VKM Ac-1602]PPI62554.1 hypothetical protein C5E08_02825 [Rathayibacter iranicus]PWJ61200.1 calcineurin-like phosphoesterase family protein [Rathayibacter iranicus NCPPB 2253 = VKM Ac-1602]